MLSDEELAALSRTKMIAQIKINVGTVVVNLSTKFTKTEIATAREQLTNLVGAAFDRHVADAKQQWKMEKGNANREKRIEKGSQQKHPARSRVGQAAKTGRRHRH